MRKVLICFALTLSAAALRADVLNFEDLSGAGSMPANYGGINWLNNWNYYDSPQEPYNPSSGNVRIYVTFLNQASFVLPAGSSFGGAYFSGIAQEGSLTFELYQLGSLVHTSTTLAPSSTPTFLSSGYAGLVDEVRVTGNPGYYVMDDVTFNPEASTVPEPSTYALTATALGLATFIQRRRQIKRS